MFDYIRSTNLFDDTIYDHAKPDDRNSWKDAYSLNNDDGHLTFTNYRTKSERGLHMGHGQVTPNFDRLRRRRDEGIRTLLHHRGSGHSADLLRGRHRWRRRAWDRTDAEYGWRQVRWTTATFRRCMFR